MPERVAAAPAKAGLKEDGAGTEGGVIEGPSQSLKVAVDWARRGRSSQQPHEATRFRSQPNPTTFPPAHKPCDRPEAVTLKECARSVPQRRKGQPLAVLCQGGQGRSGCKGERQAEGVVSADCAPGDRVSGEDLDQRQEKLVDGVGLTSDPQRPLARTLGWGRGADPLSPAAGVHARTGHL